MTNKLCHTCGKTLPLSAFHVQTERPDGLCYHCTFCERKRAAAYYLKHAEERKAYARAYGALQRKCGVSRKPKANSGNAAGGER